MPQHPPPLKTISYDLQNTLSAFFVEMKSYIEIQF